MRVQETHDMYQSCIEQHGIFVRCTRKRKAVPGFAVRYRGIADSNIKPASFHHFWESILKIHWIELSFLVADEKVTIQNICSDNRIAAHNVPAKVGKQFFRLRYVRKIQEVLMSAGLSLFLQKLQI